jgi:hypothetical protein
MLLALFFMLRPMLLLTFSVTIFDKLTSLTCLETGTPLLAALGAALGRCIYKIIHPEISFVVLFLIWAGPSRPKHLLNPPK